MSNFDSFAACAVCRRPNQGAFTSGPLEGFCERCAWNHDTEQLRIERAQEEEMRRAEEARVPFRDVGVEHCDGQQDIKLSFQIRVF